MRWKWVQLAWTELYNNPAKGKQTLNKWRPKKKTEEGVRCQLQMSLPFHSSVITWQSLFWRSGTHLQLSVWVPYSSFASPFPASQWPPGLGCANLPVLYHLALLGDGSLPGLPGHGCLRSTRVDDFPSLPRASPALAKLQCPLIVPCHSHFSSRQWLDSCAGTTVEIIGSKLRGVNLPLIFLEVECEQRGRDAMIAHCSELSPLWLRTAQTDGWGPWSVSPKVFCYCTS